MRALLVAQVLFVLLVSLVVLPAQNLASGDPAELRQWLAQGRDRPEYPDVLLRLLRTAPDLDTFTRDLERYADGVTLDSDRQRVYMEAGYVHETANRYFEAGRWYARVLEIDPSNWDALLRRAAMSIEIGEHDEAIVLLTRAVQGAPDRTLQRQAAILRARAFLLDERFERAYQHALALVGEQDHESIEPVAVLLLFEISQAIDRPEGLELARRIFAEQFPDSPEQALVVGEATYLPNPSRIVPTTVPVVTEAPVDTGNDNTTPPAAPSPRRVRGVQVGSFRDPENARYMRLDMESLGFGAQVEEYRINDELYHRVLIPIPDDADDAAVQARVLELKERGIEGMLLFQ